MSFKEKLVIMGCFVGYHATLLGLDDSILWVIPAGFFIFFALTYIDMKVKQ